jgi:DNA modification methylase
MSHTDLRVKIIRTDGGTQSRVQLDWLAVDEYTHAMQEGATFPPVVVFHDGQEYWCADGFHRLQAAERAGLETVAADVRQGTRRDAVLYSVGANSSHGVRRTNADKRAAVLLLLNDAEWALWSDGAVASKCGVSQAFVSSLRRSLPTQNGFESVRKGADGRKINTAAIGKRTETAPAEPEPQEVFDWTEEGEGEPGKFTEEHKCETVGPEPATLEGHYLPPRHPAAAHDSTSGASPHMAVHVHNADAAQGIRAYVTDPVHLVVTSPPYNVGIDYDMHADDMGTHLDMLTDVWRRCHEVMAEGARICVVVPFGVGRSPWVPFAARIMETLQAAGFTLRGQIVWDKNTTGNRTSWGSWRMPSAPALRDTTESIVVAHKGSGTLAIPDDVLCTDGEGRKYAPWLSADYFMELAQDHWAISPESAQRVKHPAPYPVELVTRLIHFYAFPGAHVLDPFGGSGTTGVAAVQQGCAATLFDISAQYCQLAQERINGY